MGTPIVIYGAGGLGREALELIRDINRAGGSWDVVAFATDDAASRDRTTNGVPVMSWEEARRAGGGSPHLVIGIGSPVTRLRLSERLRGQAAGFPVLVHPSVVRSAFIEIGEGVVITAGNVLTANITLGPFALLNLTCTVGHDCVLGAYVSVSPGANISGNVTIGEGCDLGTASSYVPQVTVGAWSVVGAGAVVATDLPANCIAAGVPARVTERRPDGWHLLKHGT